MHIRVFILNLNTDDLVPAHTICIPTVCFIKKEKRRQTYASF